MGGTASAKEGFSVIHEYPFEGDLWLEVGITSYEDISKVAAVEYEGRLYGYMSWNSDRMRAYFSTGKSYARVIMKEKLNG